MYQSKVVNKVNAMYLRGVTNDRSRAWTEYCYNTSVHTTLRATPFEVVYSQPPRLGTARTETTDALLHSHDKVLVKVHQQLLQA